MEAMLGFLRRQVGLRTDSASASGSLHAKTAYAASMLNATVASRYPFPEPKYIPFYFLGEISPSVGVWQEVLNVVNKSGYITDAIIVGMSSSSSFEMRLTIDGSVVFHDSVSMSGLGGERYGPAGIIHASSIMSNFVYSSSGGGDYKIGVIHKTDFYNPSITEFGNRTRFYSTYPSSSIQYERILVIHEPLRWGSSCKLEFKKNGDVTSFHITYSGAIAV